MSPPFAQPDIDRVIADLQRMRDEVAHAIVGQSDLVDMCAVALLAGGHILLEGVPGLGKTELVKTLARVLDLRFSRIQFTPDMFPMDITGTHLLIEGADGQREFQFRRGPVFAHVVLADEINRATPKTQSALLEAMQERSVTVGRETIRLEDPFVVIATQNPLEMEGTYPLPEAQLDRFLFKLLVRFPEADDLGRILDRTTTAAQPNVEKVLSRERILELRAVGLDVALVEGMRDLVVRLVMATHPDRDESPELVRRFVRYGASPRGGQAIVVGAKMHAMMSGRGHVTEEDIRAVFVPALRHRLLLNFEGEAEGLTTDRVLAQVAEHVKLGDVLG